MLLLTQIDDLKLELQIQQIIFKNGHSCIKTLKPIAAECNPISLLQRVMHFIWAVFKVGLTENVQDLSRFYYGEIFL